jgi:endoglucanase
VPTTRPQLHSRRRTTLLLRVLSGGLAVAVLALGLAHVQTARAATPATTVRTVHQVQYATPGMLYGSGLTVQKDSVAAGVVASLTKRHYWPEVRAISQISSQPVSIWLGDWYSKAQLVKVIQGAVATAKKTNTTASFVTYAIPDRDCGGYSAGGLTPSQYLAWNATIATALRGQRAVVLVEPDSLAMLSNCPSLAAERLPLIKSAVQQFAANGDVAYLDAGNSNWVDPKTMASRLVAAGVGQTRGFFTNVSNFYPVQNEVAYADRVSALTSGSHYVIDVSRNGRGWKGTWCNPAGAGLGRNPAVSNGRTKLDATLWVKTPGASDGTCNGGPAAGTWWEQYALALVKNRAK